MDSILTTSIDANAVKSAALQITTEATLTANSQYIANGSSIANTVATLTANGSGTYNGQILIDSTTLLATFGQVVRRSPYRTLKVYSEDRTIIVEAEDRTLTIAAQSRAIKSLGASTQKYLMEVM